MRLLGRVGCALLRRAAPALDRAQFAEQSAVYRAAVGARESRLSDEHAKLELQAAIAAYPNGVASTLSLLGQGRDSYAKDRAFRLLSAATTGGPVKPMPPESADLFTRERELGHLPLRDAFARLKSLEPALAELEREIAAGRLTPARGHGFSMVEIPLGRTVAHDEPLLRSDLALNIAAHYLNTLRASDAPTDLETPYFEAPRRTKMSTGVLLGRPKPPPERAR
jgi:hypothetical protein